LGIDNVIISSAALEESFLNEIVKDFKVTISLDFKDNKMFIKGWKEKSNLTFENALNIFSKYTRRFIYTEISKDGTLDGIENIPKINSDFDFIYAGGISSKEDIEKLKITGFNGVIIGKAIYENKLSLKELI
jgi:phosphoribosylformimino-5-aminoimidazole carboxamide ribotide isomerase